MALNPNCHIIGVLGGKGGVGKSVFAVNFALSIMAELKAPVLLIDADQKSCGDQNVLLGLRPLKTVSEVANYQGSLNQQAMSQIVTTHPSGLGFIGAVRGPDESLQVNAPLFMKQLEFLSQSYRYIIVDLGTDIHEFQKTLLQEATMMILVTAPEVLVVNQTQRLINELLTATFPLEMMSLVVNKMNSSGLSPQVIGQNLRLPVVGVIPQDDITTTASVQRGQPFALTAQRTPIYAAYTDVVRRVTGGPLQRLKTLVKPQASQSQTSSGPIASMESSGVDPRTALKIRVHNELIKAMDLKKGITETNNDPAKEAALRQKTLQSITQIVDRESPGLAREERSKVIKEVLEEALGLGPLEDLLADPAVTEIMVNGFKRIFIEKNGKIQMSPVTFTSNTHLRNVIERIVTPLGRRIDEKTPYVDARLKDGSRVNAVIEPLSIDGPAVTIRKFKKGGISAEKYIEYGSLTKQMIDFLKICVENGMNVVISGGTGSGKTSLLNMLSSFIPSNERIVTVEDAAELQMQQEHVVRLETRPANMDGAGAITIRDLVKNSLRMRPDRIVVGETRDGAALDMLQAMNTGHDGSMTTTHANSPRECISRLETLCLMAGMDLPSRAIREQIASAVHLIIQISRLSDGSRRVTSITEVVGMQGDVITLAEIFKFKETGFDKNRRILGQFQAAGHIPTFISKLEAKGVVISRDIFNNAPQTQATGPKPVAAGMPPGSLPGMAQLKKTGTGGKP